MMATHDWRPATVTSTNTFLNQLPLVWVHVVMSFPLLPMLHCGTDEVELPPPLLTSVSAVPHVAQSAITEENGHAEAEPSTSAQYEPPATQGVSSAKSSAAVQQDSTDANRCVSKSANEVTLMLHLTPHEIAPSVSE